MSKGRVQSDTNLRQQTGCTDSPSKCPGSEDGRTGATFGPEEGGFADFVHGGECPHDDQVDDFWDCFSAASSCAP